MRVDFGIAARHRTLTVATILLAVPGCDAPERSVTGETATLPGPVESVVSPPREGSAEPHLSAGRDGPVLSWLEPGDGGAYDLRMARWNGDAWSDATTAASSDRFFVNWADFPSVVPVGDTLWAHWLERGEEGGYDYGVRVARSTDGGATWGEALTPHEDGTPTEHGFVSTFPHPDGGAGFVWLDGRLYAQGPDGGAPTEEMTLRARRFPTEGPPGPTRVLDARVCDCCQTDAAVTSAGPVVVYRDRSPDEVRDIYVTRLGEGGWTEGRPVHRDGWTIEACPVNGPAIAAAGSRVAVAWFTAARDTAAVHVAFSDDAGATFGLPTRVDGGRPAGRVDVVALADGSALVSWIERVGEGGAELRVRRIGRDGSSLAPSIVSTASAARAGGFPQMIAHDGRLHFAWTEVEEGGATAVRTAVAPLPPAGAADPGEDER